MLMGVMRAGRTPRVRREMNQRRAVSAVPSTGEQGGRRRKAMAILAGGLVLGIGAAVTLAAWNDSEFATGVFGSGAFDLEGSVDGASFTSDPTAPGKSLSFELDAGSLAPGDVVAVPFAVQLSADSSYAADVSISASGDEPIAAGLTYSVVDTGAFAAECDAETPGDPLVTDAAAAASTTADAFSLTSAGAPRNLCIIVTAGDALPQSAAGAVTWKFVATSTDPLP